MNKEIMKASGFGQHVKDVENKICPFCKKPISGFRDKLSQKEYSISGLCQSCQDKTFGAKAMEKEILPTEEIIKGVLNRRFKGSLLYVAQIDGSLGVGNLLSDEDEYSLTDTFCAVAYQFLKGQLEGDTDCRVFYAKMAKKYKKENNLQEKEN